VACLFLSFATDKKFGFLHFPTGSQSATMNLRVNTSGMRTTLVPALSVRQPLGSAHHMSRLGTLDDTSVVILDTLDVRHTVLGRGENAVELFAFDAGKDIVLARATDGPM